MTILQTPESRFTNLPDYPFEPNTLSSPTVRPPMLSTPTTRRFQRSRAYFLMLVPTSTQDPATPANRTAWLTLRQWKKPFLTAFSDGDPITVGADRLFQNLFPVRKTSHT